MLVGDFFHDRVAVVLFENGTPEFPVKFCFSLCFVYFVVIIVQ